MEDTKADEFTRGDWMDSKKVSLFAVVIALSLFVQFGFATDFNQTYFNLNNTATTSDIGPLDSTVVWNFTATGIGDSHVVFSGGILYAGSTTAGGARGNLLAFNASNGTLIWNYSNTTNFVNGMMTNIIHHPVVDSGRVYFDHDGGNVYALNATNGQLLWNFSTANSTRAPAVSDNILYVSSFDGNLYALNATTGAKLWNFSMPGSGNIYPPAIERVNNATALHRVYISNEVPAGLPGSVNGTFALDTNSTSFIVAWNNSNHTFGTGAAFTQIIRFNPVVIIRDVPPSASPVTIVNNGTGKQETSSAVSRNGSSTTSPPPSGNGSNGSSLGILTHDGTQADIAAAALTPTRILVIGKTQNVNGTLFLINATNGTVMNNFSIGTAVAALRFTIGAGILYLTTTYIAGVNQPTNLIALNLTNGQVIWNRSIGTNTPSITGGGPIVTEGTLFMTTVANDNVISIDDTAINPLGPANNLVVNTTRPEFNFSITNTTFGPRTCALFVNLTNMAVNDTTQLNTNTNLTPTANLSNGTNVWFVGCITPSGIARQSATRTLILNISAGGQQGGDSSPPTINVSMNSTQATAGIPVLVNVTANDSQSNVTLLSVNITNQGGAIAVGCGSNITNANITNVNCIFTNNTPGTYLVNVIARDGSNNVGTANASFNITAIGADVNPPTVTIATNASFAQAGTAILVNVSANDSASNMSSLDVRVNDPSGFLAAICGINTTNASSVNVNCAFSNSSSGGTYAINVNARDGAGNVLLKSVPITFVNPTPNTSSSSQANVTILGFTQIRANYSVFVPSFGGANQTNASLSLVLNQTLMPIFIDKPFFAGPTVFENLAYNYTLLINVSAGLANGTPVNVTIQTGTNIPAKMQDFTFNTPEGNRTATMISPSFDQTFTIFTNNIRGVSNNQSGAVNGTFTFPNFNNPYVNVNLRINASNSTTPYQVNVTLLFPSRGPVFVINQAYEGFNFTRPPPLGSVLNQTIFIDVNDSEQFFSPTNVFLETMFPQNVTVFNVNGSVNLTQQIASNAQIAWFNFSSGAFENATGNLAAYNITTIAGCFNVTHNLNGSALQGRNVSPCMTGFRYNLGAANLSWVYGSRARINVTVTLNFSLLGQTISGNGTGGQVSQCNVSADMPVQGGSVTVPDTCAPNTCSATSLNVTINGQTLNSSQFICGSIVITGASLNLGPNDISVSYFVPTASVGGGGVGGNANTQTITIGNVEASCNLVKATVTPTSGIITRLLYKSTGGYIEIGKVPYGGTVSFSTNYSGAHQIEAAGAGYLPATMDITVPACTAVTTPVQPTPNATQPGPTQPAPNVTQPTTPTEPSKPVEQPKVDVNLQVKQETLQIIQTVQKDVDKAKSEGRDIKEAQASLDQALAAYNSGDYSGARVKALEANRTITTAITPAVTTNATTSTQGAGAAGLLLLIVAVVALVIVGAFLVYYLFIRK